MDFGFVKTTLSTIAQFITAFKNTTGYYTTKSLPEATKLTRVEPLAIVSTDCLTLDYMPDVMQSMLSMFSGYYLQAVDLLTKVNDVEVVRILDKLNPDRDESYFLLYHDEDRHHRPVLESLVKANFSLEAYKHSLPTRATVQFAMEDNDKNFQKLNEVSNLSIGKLLNVKITYGSDNEQKPKFVEIPVSVRLLASAIPNSSIAHLMAHQTEDLSLVERYHAWRSGRISFIRDLMFCQDLIDEHRRARMGDESGTMQEIMRRVLNSKKYGILSKNPSLVSASSLFVITEDLARDVESKLGGKLSNAKVRQKMFENTYAMIVCVIDREYERVTFYTRGIAASASFSVKEIKANAKGKGPDIMDLMKSFNMGAPAMF